MNQIAVTLRVMNQSRWAALYVPDPGFTFFEGYEHDTILAKAASEIERLESELAAASFGGHPFRRYTAVELVDILHRSGFVECDIAACNCGSWHHRYGLPERFNEIHDLLRDAGVLDNSTGNLASNAIKKLIEQRDSAAKSTGEQ